MFIFTPTIQNLLNDYKYLRENKYLSEFLTTKFAGDENIFEWFFVIDGIKNSPLAKGQYFGSISFPKDYPNPRRRPVVVIITPNGRVVSMDDICYQSGNKSYWTRELTIKELITGIITYLTSDGLSNGIIETTEAQKITYAEESRAFNQFIPKFKEIFPDIYKEYGNNFEELTLMEKVRNKNDFKRLTEHHSLEKINEIQNSWFSSTWIKKENTKMLSILVDFEYNEFLKARSQWFKEYDNRIISVSKGDQLDLLKLAQEFKKDENKSSAYEKWSREYVPSQYRMREYATRHRDNMIRHRSINYTNREYERSMNCNVCERPMGHHNIHSNTTYQNPHREFGRPNIRQQNHNSHGGRSMIPTQGNEFAKPINQSIPRERSVHHITQTKTERPTNYKRDNRRPMDYGPQNERLVDNNINPYGKNSMCYNSDSEGELEIDSNSYQKNALDYQTIKKYLQENQGQRVSASDESSHSHKRGSAELRYHFTNLFSRVEFFFKNAIIKHSNF